jgi:hypothetical protein
VIQLILFLILGTGFLFVIYRFARRSPRVEGSAQNVLRAREALVTLQGGLLSPQMVERIFAKADYEYVVTATPRHVHELFLEERQKVALSWVNQVREQILNLRHFHQEYARFYSRLSLRTEIRLAFEFLTLLCICRALDLALYFRGPYAAPRLVGQVATAAVRVCTISETSMGFLKGAQIDALRHDPARNLTMS